MGVKLIHDLELCTDCTNVRFPPGYSTGPSRQPQGLEVLPQQHQPISHHISVPSSAHNREQKQGGLWVACPDSGPRVSKAVGTTTQTNVTSDSEHSGSTLTVDTDHGSVIHHEDPIISDYVASKISTMLVKHARQTVY